MKKIIIVGGVIGAIVALSYGIDRRVQFLAERPLHER